METPFRFEVFGLRPGPPDPFLIGLALARMFHPVNDSAKDQMGYWSDRKDRISEAIRLCQHKKVFFPQFASII
jgi:hypothetical protein